MDKLARPVDKADSTSGAEKLVVMPITLREANDFVQNFHRHNGRTSRDGGKFALGAGCESVGLVGVAIVGNPLSATLMDGWTAEVLRVCVKDDSPKNTCSFLYGASWRVWRAMGGHRLITYTLKTESGASLRGAGWRVVGETRPVAAGWRKNDHLNPLRTWTPVMGQSKFRWEASTALTAGTEQNPELRTNPSETLMKQENRRATTSISEKVGGD